MYLALRELYFAGSHANHTLQTHAAAVEVGLCHWWEYHITCATCVMLYNCLVCNAVQAGQVLQQAAKRRGPTDVALLLSVINSAVLLLLLVGLGTAATLARSGDLQAALDTWLPASSVGDVAKQGLFALVRSLKCIRLGTHPWQCWTMHLW